MGIEFQFSVKGANILALQKAGMEGIRSLLDLAPDAPVFMPTQNGGDRGASYGWWLTDVRDDVAIANASGSRVTVWSATIRGVIR